MKAKWQHIFLVAGLMIAPMASWAVVGVSGSFTGGTENNENDGSVLDNMFDSGTASYFQALQDDGVPTFSFVVDLESAIEVRNITIWGYERYRYNVLGPGGVTTIAVGDSPTGPFTVIGSADFGSSRDDALFSGGPLGEMIEADTPTVARYVQISSNWTFDNLLRISLLDVNKDAVIYNTVPRHNPDLAATDTVNNPLGFEQRNVFDLGGPIPRRSAENIVDGVLSEGAIPLILPLELYFDIGSDRTIDKIVVHEFDTDTALLPGTGEVWVSSTDDRNNLDTLLFTFDVTGQPGEFGTSVEIDIPNTQKRYFMLKTTANQLGESQATSVRYGEVQFIDADQNGGPVNSANYWFLY